MEIDNANLAETEDQPIPERSTFTCLRNVDLLQTAFRVPDPSMSFIVLHEEYRFLRELLENSDRTFVVTGQPGTGS